MRPWELLAMLLAGAVGVGSLARSSAAQAARTSDEDLLNRAVNAALTSESDPVVLRTFAGMLHDAGYASYASAIGARAAIKSGVQSSLGRTITIARGA